MSEAPEIEWPREIWMAAREEHDQGVISGVLSEWATIARWEGDKERDREFHRYIDADVYDSAEKYWKQRVEAAVRAERERCAAIALNRWKYWTDQSGVSCDVTACEEISRAILADPDTEKG